MRIGVIGGGNMGGGLGRHFAAEHEVHVGSRDPERGKQIAEQIGAAGSGGYREVAERSEVLLFTVPWWGVDETLAELGDLDGKILIDVTNPYKDDTYSEQHEFPGSSASEEIQKKAGGARVVKAWNHVYAQIVNSSPDFDGTPAAVFIAGDDEEAKKAVMGLAEEIGYEPVDAGPLSSARYLERLAGLAVTLAYGLGMGTDQAFKLIRR